MSDSVKRARQAGTSVTSVLRSITSDMIVQGVSAYEDWTKRGETLDCAVHDLVCEIYAAMEVQRLDSREFYEALEAQRLTGEGDNLSPEIRRLAWRPTE